MDETTPAATDHPPSEFDDGLPEGSHALEIAARAGFGPLSPFGQEVWHGHGIPCVSCGQLVRRNEASCGYCGQDLSEEMIRKMRLHAGPWFVLEHVRPFPGISLERVVRQIRRGLITETSIVRGPSSDYQWRFAVETPGLCRYFGKCWCCHAPVTLSDIYCSQCLHYQSFEKPRPTLQVPETIPAAAQASPEAMPRPETTPGQSLSAALVGSVPPRASGGMAGSTLQRESTGLTSGPAGAASLFSRPTATPAAETAPPAPASRDQPLITPRDSSELAKLSAAVRQARMTRQADAWDQPPKVGGVKVTWIAAILIVAALVTLLLISRARSSRPASPLLPTMQNPLPGAQTAAPGQSSPNSGAGGTVPPIAPTSAPPPMTTHQPVAPPAQPGSDAPNPGAAP